MLLQMDRVSCVTVLRDIVDSKVSLMTVSVLVVVVVEVVEVVEEVVDTVVVEVDLIISSVVSDIKTSQDSICSCLSCDLNQTKHFRNTDTAIERRLMAFMISPITFKRKKIVSDSKVYSSYSVQIHIRMLQASSCRWCRLRNRTYSIAMSIMDT